jgi:hypothetical protein
MNIVLFVFGSEFDMGWARLAGLLAKALKTGKGTVCRAAEINCQICPTDSRSTDPCQFAL